jgi:hypothetical protein
MLRRNFVVILLIKLNRIPTNHYIESSVLFKLHGKIYFNLKCIDPFFLQ